MNKVNTNITLDPIIKQKSMEIFSKLGLDFSTGISLYLNQVVIKKGLPFELNINDDEWEPNEETIAAFAEEQEMKTNKKKYKRYNTFAEYRKKNKVLKDQQNKD